MLQHIEDLGVDEWAAAAKRAAVDAVASAQRAGKTPPAELVAVAAMTERQLVEHRTRNGPARKRLSPVMQLVDADRLRRVAEGHAGAANQDKLDAEAAAAIAQAEAEESARAVTAAREQARAAQTQAAQKEQQRAAERAAHEQALQQVRGELERVRVDAEAEVAAAREQASAADARAQQRAAERTDERAANEQALQQLRGELERVRAAAEADVAAARGWAAGEAAAVRDAADAEVARARAAADDAIRQAQAAEARTASRLLSIPVPPWEVRAQSSHIENALNALQQIDHVLEVGMADGAESDTPLDVDLMNSLVWVVQDHAIYLSNEARNAAGTTAQSPDDAAATYAEAAAGAFRAFLQRIETAARALGNRDRSPDAEIVSAVSAMLSDPWVQEARRLGSATT